MNKFPENRENNREFLKSGLRFMGVLEGFSEGSSWPFPKLCNLTFNYYNHTTKLHFRRAAKPMPYFKAGPVGWVERKRNPSYRLLHLLGLAAAGYETPFHVFVCRCASGSETPPL